MAPYVSGETGVRQGLVRSLVLGLMGDVKPAGEHPRVDKEALTPAAEAEGLSLAET